MLKNNILGILGYTKCIINISFIGFFSLKQISPHGSARRRLAFYSIISHGVRAFMTQALGHSAIIPKEMTIGWAWCWAQGTP